MSDELSDVPQPHVEFDHWIGRAKYELGAWRAVLFPYNSKNGREGKPRFVSGMDGVPLAFPTAAAVEEALPEIIDRLSRALEQ